jgi:hypothetical protein
LTPDETDTLLDRSKELLEDFNPDDHPLTKFTTSDHSHVGDEYFLNSSSSSNSSLRITGTSEKLPKKIHSGDKIRYFLEEDAVDENGKLTREKHKSVNKIGHGELV